jgi:protein phosphatase
MMKANPEIRPANMHALTQSIGGSSELIQIEPHFYLLSVTREARFIICTDGLTDMVSAKDIERIAVPMLNPVAVVQALFSAAMEAGGRDNITIAVVDVEKA